MSCPFTISVDIPTPEAGDLAVRIAGLDVQAWYVAPDEKHGELGGWHWLVRVDMMSPLRVLHGTMQIERGDAVDRRDAIRQARTHAYPRIEEALRQAGRAT